ncbi:MAG: TonB-dependent receptor, partial [Sphingobacteriaceae bacterium]|nr:TonB-dependent receptor [Sphingobacteriaceae bacterium]
MKKQTVKIGIIAFFVAITGQVFAQSIKGKVTDSAGVAIPGVSIKVVGTKIGTSTNESGSYSLKLPKNGEYRIRAIHASYQSTESLSNVESEDVTLNFKLQEGKQTLESVSIIGSRSSVPRTNIESAVPIDLITSKDVKSFAQVDLSQILNYVAPSFSSNRQTVADGTDHIDPASLRGLGPDQVLVLVNGKRRHTTALVNINGTFGRGTVGTDLNAIPVAAIERIEVLRDGAAAQYGSDAIAGVINIVLKKVTPYSFSTSYGQSNSETLGRKFNDGANFQVDFSKGWEFANKKGFVNVAAQYLDRGYTNRGGLDTRPLLYTGNPSKLATESEEQFVERFKALKVIDDAKAKANGLDRNNMRVGNGDSRGFSAFVNGQYNLNKNTELYFATGYTRKSGQAGGFYRLPFESSKVDLS